MSLDITPLIPAGKQVVEGYGDGGFRIAGARHEGAVLITPERTEPWSIAAPDQITVETARALATRLAGAGVEILVIGCGASFVPLSPELGVAVRHAGVALEWMDTAAACRTYTVLLIEGRAVAAALLAIP